MVNRRKFLEAGALAGVGAMLPWQAAQAATKVASKGSRRAAAMVVPGAGISPPLAKYVQGMIIPWAYTPRCDALGNPVLDPNNGGVIYDIPLKAFTQQLHPALAPTPLWGFGGTYPSISIEATVGVPVNVNWINALTPADVHPVAMGIDRTNIDGMLDPATGLPWPDQRITTHLHGAHVASDSDGGPQTWYTWPGGPVGPMYPANGSYYTYDNKQPGTTLWFHDHAMGLTRLNVIAGGAGFYLLRDPSEQSLNLPSGAYEIPIAIQDRIFNPDGSLYYPPPPAMPEFFGDTFVVNGAVWPRVKVEPRKYRFRLLNGCNSRFLRIQLVQAAGAVGAETLPSLRRWITTPFTQIGAEGGFFAAPAPPQTILTIAPAERADVIVDFSALAGKSLIMFNDAGTPFTNTADTRGAIPEVMLFEVAAAVTAPDNSVIPASFPTGGFLDWNGGTTYKPDLTVATNVVKELNEITLPNGMLMQLINRVGYEKDPLTGMMVPPDQVTRGTTEIWQIVNTTVDTHPIHLHHSMFQVLDRTPMNMTQYVAKASKKKLVGAVDPLLFLRGAPVPAGPTEQGWKDTVQAHPGELTRIAVKWMNHAGDYVYHCHILEHEEHDMMRALTVL